MLVQGQMIDLYIRPAVTKYPLGAYWLVDEIADIGQFRDIDQIDTTHLF